MMNGWRMRVSAKKEISAKWNVDRGWDVNGVDMLNAK